MTIFFFYLKESFSPEVKSAEDIEKFKFMSFGSVPDLNFSQNVNHLFNKLKLRVDLPMELLNSPVYTQPDSPQAFVFGAIRSKIFHNIEKSPEDFKIIAVTSPRQSEGKSLIAGKLASSIALTGQKTLFIDGDLIRKDISHQLHLEDYEGLKEILLGGTELKDVIVKSELYDSLHILPAGKGRGSIADVLLTRTSKEFFEQCRQQYDLVIIDTPALLIAPDALLLCRFSDLTSLVVTASQTRLHDVELTRSELTDNGVENIGCILNRYGSLLKYVYYLPVKRRKDKPAS